MITVTLSSKGQLTIPRQLRQVLGLVPGARLQVSVDAQGRLVLVPSRYEPDDLFRHRPPVDRLMGLEDMEQAIAAGVVSPER
jgi:AbrB family looped-hinge helix DNA binding protein